MKKTVLLGVSHLLAVGLGFAIGIYALPILTAPEAPTLAEVESLVGDVEYRGQFRKDLEGSDLLHWGEGEVSVSSTAIALKGEVSPGPNYKLYLTPEFVETEEDFTRVRDRSVQLGDVKTFKNFVVGVPELVDLTQYNSVVVWCEAFSEFITAAKYR
jgi:hypothetical protein